MSCNAAGAGHIAGIGPLRAAGFTGSRIRVLRAKASRQLMDWCPKCQASAARRWLETRQADLLPMEYYHVVFTLPAAISAIAWYNKTVIYGLLFDIAAETLRTIAADPRHLGGFCRNKDAFLKPRKYDK